MTAFGWFVLALTWKKISQDCLIRRSLATISYLFHALCFYVFHDIGNATLAYVLKGSLHNDLMILGLLLPDTRSMLHAHLCSMISQMHMCQWLRHDQTHVSLSFTIRGLCPVHLCISPLEMLFFIELMFSPCQHLSALTNLSKYFPLLTLPRHCHFISRIHSYFHFTCELHNDIKALYGQARYNPDCISRNGAPQKHCSHL